MTDWNAVMNHPRKRKKHIAAMHSSEVQRAYVAGVNNSIRPNARNPYPPGKRHDAWNKGRVEADPLGDWHGRNE